MAVTSSDLASYTVEGEEKEKLVLTVPEIGQAYRAAMVAA